MADIHFDHRLAVESIRHGADKIRINPGNIGSRQAIKKIVEAAAERRVPIRVGVNSGSLEADILKKYKKPTAKALFESAKRNVGILAELGFEDIVVSIKSSSAPVCVEAYRMFAETFSYPLHLGVTEAGTYESAVIKASAALGSLLMDGIGDTIRVSITGDPKKEVIAAKNILAYTGIRKRGLEVISCPTCGRCSIDVEQIAMQIEQRFAYLNTPLTVAVMGCVVNGPGEAKEADVGIAGGKDAGVLFVKGKMIKKVAQKDMVIELISYIEKII